MTDKEQNELNLTNRQRILYEYYESHPEELEKLTVALRAITETVSDVVVKLSEALTPIIVLLGPFVEAMAGEDLINDEEDSEDD